MPVDNFSYELRPSNPHVVQNSVAVITKCLPRCPMEDRFNGTTDKLSRTLCPGVRKHSTGQPPVGYRTIRQCALCQLMSLRHQRTSAWGSLYGSLGVVERLVGWCAAYNSTVLHPFRSLRRSVATWRLRLLYWNVSVYIRTRHTEFGL